MRGSNPTEKTSVVAEEKPAEVAKPEVKEEPVTEETPTETLEETPLEVAEPEVKEEPKVEETPAEETQSEEPVAEPEASTETEQTNLTPETSE